MRQAWELQGGRWLVGLQSDQPVMVRGKVKTIVDVGWDACEVVE